MGGELNNSMKRVKRDQKNDMNLRYRYPIRTWYEPLESRLDCLSNGILYDTI